MDGTACGIVTERGRCKAAPLPGSPLNLCAKHIRQAAELYADVAYQSEPQRRIPQRCPSCNARALVLEPVTARIKCSMCGAEQAAMPRQLPAPKPPALDPQAEVVYYISFGDRVKIGYTASLARRMVQLPHDSVLAVERGGRDLEKQRHRQFRHLRITPRGEWFRKEPDLLAFIGAIDSVA